MTIFGSNDIGNNWVKEQLESSIQYKNKILKKYNFYSSKQKDYYVIIVNSAYVIGNDDNRTTLTNYINAHVFDNWSDVNIVFNNIKLFNSKNEPIIPEKIITAKEHFKTMLDDTDDSINIFQNALNKFV